MLHLKDRMEIIRALPQSLVAAVRVESQISPFIIFSRFAFRLFVAQLPEIVQSARAAVLSLGVALHRC